MKPKFLILVRFGSGSRFFRFSPRFSVFASICLLHGAWAVGRLCRTRCTLPRTPLVPGHKNREAKGEQVNLQIFKLKLVP